MPTSQYPGGFNFGVSIRGMPVLTSYPGKVFWVDSTAGTDSGKGTFDRPFDTIDYAVGRCRASKGDLIMAKAGHVETVIAAAGLSLDVIGITIIGLGNGNLRPQINFTTAVGADMNVDAANISMHNFRFTGGVDLLTGPIDINAADFTLTNFITQDVTGASVDFIVTDDNADRFFLSGWTHRGTASAGPDTAISTVGGDDWVIEDFNIYGNFAVGGIENLTTASNRVRIGGGPGPNYIWTEHANDIAITMKSDSTGYIGPNLFLMLQDNAANFAGATVGAAMQFMKPIQIVNLAGESSGDTTITASTNA